ncbi:MAG TPA: DUF5655 domain-containing protein, partial [Ignavibacteriaceae bacterium]|nr:DUF5655 domain-containing protein [Ignavibacteriaceae bacterium]
MEEKDLFSGKSPAVFDIYQRILKEVKVFGKIISEVNQSSIHLKNKTAFGGVHPKKNWLDFNLVTDHPLKDKRITKVEQVSRNRYHNNFRFSTPDEVDKSFAR